MPEDRTPNNNHDAPPQRSKSLIERWPCEVEQCRNHGQICYWSVSDTAEDHLPVTSVVMQYWIAAIARRECTVDSPPPEVIEQWQRQNLRALQQKVKRRERKADRKFARNPSSPRASFWRQRKEYQSSPLKNSTLPTGSDQEAVSERAGMGVG